MVLMFLVNFVVVLTQYNLPLDNATSTNFMPASTAGADSRIVSVNAVDRTFSCCMTVNAMVPVSKLRHTPEASDLLLRMPSMETLSSVNVTP